MTPMQPLQPTDPRVREAQRVAHLVLGQPRPKAKRRNKRDGAPVVLSPGIEEAVLLREAWSHKANGTPETHARHAEAATRDLALARLAAAQLVASGVIDAQQPATNQRRAKTATREGALARLAETGAIDAHQLAAAQEIVAAHESLTADVAVRTARWERGSGGGPNAASFEPIARVLREMAYTRWRAAVGANGAMLLAVIVDDVGITIAARRWRMSNRRATAVLVAALDGWRRG